MQERLEQFPQILAIAVELIVELGAYSAAGFVFQFLKMHEADEQFLMTVTPASVQVKPLLSEFSLSNSSFVAPSSHTDCRPHTVLFSS